MIPDEPSSTSLVASQRVGSGIACSGEDYNTFLRQHGTDSSRRYGDCSCRFTAKAVSRTDCPPMAYRPMGSQCLCIPRDDAASSPLTLMSAKVLPELKDVLGQDTQTADRNNAISEKCDMVKERAEVTPKEMEGRNTNSGASGGNEYLVDDDLVDTAVSNGVGNGTEIGPLEPKVEDGMLGVAPTDVHVSGVYTDNEEVEAPIAVGAPLSSTIVEVTRAESQHSANAMALSPGCFSFELACDQLAQQDCPLDSSIDQSPKIRGDSSHCRAVDLHANGVNIQDVDDIAESTDTVSTHMPSLNAASNENQMNAGEGHLAKLCTLASDAEKRGKGTITLPKDTIFEAKTSENPKLGCHCDDPWRQPLEARCAAEAAGRLAAEARAGRAESALAELEAELRARHEQAESGLAVVGARVKPPGMAFSEAPSRPYTAGELLRQKEEAFEHLQSEVARLLRACEQMRRELGGARANRAASPSPPISEAALLKPSGGNGDDAGRGGRRNEGITSVSEHHSRVTNVVLATSTHHQSTEQAYEARGGTSNAPSRIMGKINDEGRFLVHEEENTKANVSGRTGQRHDESGIQERGRTNPQFDLETSRNSTSSNVDTDEEHSEGLQGQRGQRSRQRQRHGPSGLISGNTSVASSADSDETACASPVTTTSAASSCDENAHNDGRCCDSPIARAKKKSLKEVSPSTASSNGLPHNIRGQGKHGSSADSSSSGMREARRLNMQPSTQGGIHDPTMTVRDRSSTKERTRRGQGSASQSNGSHKGQRRHGPEFADGITCIEVPVGREDEGLLLGGGRVLHKLKEELGGTLEYRRTDGVVLIHGQRNGPQKAAACVRTARLLTDGTREPLAEEYDMARLCMDDLVAECIALKGLPHVGNGARGKFWNDSSPQTVTVATPANVPPAAATPRAAGVIGSVGWKAASGSSATSPDARHGNTKTAATSSSASLSAPPATTPAASGVAVVVDVGSNLPDGEYPPQAGSLRIIGETFGCVIDVAGEAAAQAAAASVAADVEAFAAGRSDKKAPLQPKGSATPVGNHDVLIWGPAGAVAEAKDAVAALVSANACAEVVVGAARIKRRDRGFWVNCETMASGMAVEVDHKRGSVWIRGRPEAVEEGRRDFHNKLASLFPGDFLAVPMPRAALKDLANARGLASAATEARAEFGRSSGAKSDDIDEDGVELWADWRCSCVRLRGAPAAVRCAAKALYAALAEWNTLEVSVRVDRSIVTRLLSRSGRILAGISSNMGITLLVEREKGVLRGRARTEEDAKEANRVLRLKVNALSMRRSEHSTSQSQPPRAGQPTAASPALPLARSDLPVVSIGKGGVGSIEENTEEAEKELTDPFDELQAFFAGGSPAGARSSDGNNPNAIKRSCIFDGIEDMPTNTNGTACNARVLGSGASRSSPLALQCNGNIARGHGPSPRTSSSFPLGVGVGGRGRGRSQSGSAPAESMSGGVSGAANAGSGSSHHAYPNPIRRGAPGASSGGSIGVGGGGRVTPSGSPPLLDVATSGAPPPPPPSSGANSSLGPGSSASLRSGSYQMFSHLGSSPSPPPHRHHQHQQHVLSRRPASWPLPPTIVTTTKQDSTGTMVDNEPQLHDGILPAFSSGTASSGIASSNGSSDGRTQALYESGCSWLGDVSSAGSGGTGSVMYNSGHVLGISPEEPNHFHRSNTPVPAGFHSRPFAVSPDPENSMSGANVAVAGIGCTGRGGIMNFRGAYSHGEYQSEPPQHQRQVHHAAGNTSFDVPYSHSYPGVIIRDSGRAGGYAW